MSTPEKISETTTTMTEKPSLVETSILSLPNDLLLSCFARVSRFYYPTLSLVCKRFRSFLSSPELYQHRSLLGRTESCLYVCLKNGDNSKPCWFTLCLKPNQTKKYVLSRIPNPPSPQAHHASFVSVGCKIYAIGGQMFSSHVSILDCGPDTWHEAPSMQMKRYHPNANVFDGKIYVVGGCASSIMEVLDPKTQTWDHVLTPLTERWNRKSAVIDEEIYMVVGDETECMAYKPKEDRWDVVEINKLNLGWSIFTYCVIDNVLFSYSKRNEIIWYDSKIRDWRNLKGLKRLPDYSLAKPKLVGYAGKMAVFWDKYVVSKSKDGYEIENVGICCAVIALEKRNNQEIWGRIELCEEMLEVSGKYSCMHALAATV